MTSSAQIGGPKTVPPAQSDGRGSTVLHELSRLMVRLLARLLRAAAAAAPALIITAASAAA